MIHIAICDDETVMQEELQKRVTDFFKGEKLEISIQAVSYTHLRSSAACGRDYL